MGDFHHISLRPLIEPQPDELGIDAEAFHLPPGVCLHVRDSAIDRQKPGSC
jgi:hypothetical protein